MSSSTATAVRASASWAVASLCNEPLPLLAAYAAHHIQLGASEVWLYLDQPDAATARALAAVPQIRVVQCDRAFWRALGKPRPNNSQKRQLEIIDHCYHATGADWLAHVDCDEYLLGQGDMARLLGAQPDDTAALVFPVAERVLTGPAPQDDMFDGLFRHALRDADLVATVYGDDSVFLKNGLTGHALGKSIMRTGRARLVPGIHSPRLKDGAGLVKRDSDAFTLLHFDGLTPLHWASKLLRFCSSPLDVRRKRKFNAARFAQMEFVKDNLHGDLAGVFDLHDRLKRLTPARQQALVRQGALSRFAHDISGALATLGLSGLTTSARAFDAALITRNPGLAPALETFRARAA